MPTSATRELKRPSAPFRAKDLLARRVTPELRLALLDDFTCLYEDVRGSATSSSAGMRRWSAVAARAVDRRAPREGGRDGSADRRGGRLLHRDPRRAGRAQARAIAYEIAPDIAARAAANLARYPKVEVRARSGVEDLAAADAIYVSAAASHPLRAWLDALKPGGRLVFPLQAAGSSGAMLILTRPQRGEAWPARLLTARPWCSSPAKGHQDSEMGRRLDQAFRRGGQSRVRSLRLRAEPSATDWVRGDGWALSTEPTE